MKMGMLIDTTKCVGCGACEEACQAQNGLPPDARKELSADRYTVVTTVGGANVRRMCMHCENPACASVCPVGALHKLPNGPVVYDADKCMGCRYCMVACPFSVPKYEWSKAIPRVRKCIMCNERLEKGQATACAEACPTGATLFGGRDDLIATAKERIRKDPSAYVDRVYGLEEAGGTSVLYISNVQFGLIGLKTDLIKEPYPMLTWKVLSKIPSIVAVVGVALTGIWWITSRREEVKKNEGNDDDKGGE